MLESKPPQAELKALLKGGLAAAAPVVAALVMVTSLSAVRLLEITGLGRMGVAAAGVVLACLGWFLWRGRWWAGLPALAAYVLALVYFALKVIRPLSAYFAVNPVEGLHDILSPLMLLSPQLVMVVICIGLGVVVWRAMRVARRLRPRPVSRLAWGLLLLWLLVLGGDYYYQAAGWRWMGDPADYVVRLCSPQSQVRQEARELLARAGVKALPALLAGLAARDVDLDCLRRGSLEMIVRLDAAALPELLAAARRGQTAALTALAALGRPQAARPLLDLYRNPPPEMHPAFREKLRQTILKLDPTLRLD
jgi:hypothetical protein